MARVIRKARNLENEFIERKKQAKRLRLFAFLFLGIGIISGMYFLYIDQIILLFLPLCLGIISIFLFTLIPDLKIKMDILKSGIEGENLTNRCIATLPESYTAFRNLTVSYKGKSNEIDTLIVGPTGVFVVETKYLNGRIYGSTKDTHWTQYKVGRGGTPYSETFYSPVKQVNTQVYRIANYLRENGIHTHINSIVYFSNTSTIHELSDIDETTPVFFAGNDGARRLRLHILNNNQQLSPEEYTAIRILLEKI